METIKLTNQRIQKIASACDVLRSFNKIPFDACLNLQRIFNQCDKIAKDYQADVKLYNARREELVGDSKEVSISIQKALREDLVKLNEKEYSVNVHVMKLSVFPKEMDSYGNKEVTLQDGTKMQLPYIDAFLDLLDVVIIDDSKYDDYLLVLCMKEKEKLEEVPA